MNNLIGLDDVEARKREIQRKLKTYFKNQTMFSYHELYNALTDYNMIREIHMLKDVDDKEMSYINKQLKSQFAYIEFELECGCIYIVECDNNDNCILFDGSKCTDFRNENCCYV